MAAEACEALAQRLLAADPAAEEAHRALIRLHLLQARTNAALQQFEQCREALLRDLGVEPEFQTRDLLASQPEPSSSPRRPLSDPAPPSLAARGSRDQPSIIVMPFDNLSGENDEYFVDGVVEEVTAALSRVRDFFVIARQSAFTYKGRFVDVREVGRQLGVDYVVEGTVRRGGDRLRISVQLVDTETRAQLWSERYEGTVEDVFEFRRPPSSKRRENQPRVKPPMTARMQMKSRFRTSSAVSGPNKNLSIQAKYILMRDSVPYYGRTLA